MSRIFTPGYVLPFAYGMRFMFTNKICIVGELSLFVWCLTALSAQIDYYCAIEV